MSKRAKINYYRQAIDEVTNESKTLYRHLKSLLGRENDCPTPESHNQKIIGEDFATLFDTKIKPFGRLFINRTHSSPQNFLTPSGN